MNINPHNVLILEGRISQFKEYSAGKAANISLAIDNNGKDVTYLSVKSFAPTVYKELAIGMKIRIYGHVSASSYEKNGQKIYATDLIADNIEFLESKATIRSRSVAKDIAKETEQCSDLY